MHNSSPAALEELEHRLKNGAEQLNIALTDDQAAQMVEHARQLLVWNKKINLTAIKAPLQVAEKHYIDCICSAKVFDLSQTILDVGSGGGFPGVPLKIMNPSLTICMIDASRKKVNFLKHVIRQLKLKNIGAIHARVEDLHCDNRYAEQFDSVICRAFTQLERFAKLSQPFLKPGGRIFAMKGRNAKDEITPVVRAQFDIEDHAYLLPFEKSERHILSLSPKP